MMTLAERVAIASEIARRFEAPPTRPRARVWKSPDGRHERVYPEHERRVDFVAVDPDGIDIRRCSMRGLYTIAQTVIAERTHG